MEKEFEQVLKDDFKSMRTMLADIEKHLLTQDFGVAFSFYRPLRDIMFEAVKDIYEHKRQIQDVGDALLDIEMGEK